MSEYRGALLLARQLMLPLEAKPCSSSSNSEKSDLGSQSSTHKPYNNEIHHADIMAHDRALAAVNLISHEHALYKKQHDEFLDECDSLSDMCNDLEAHIVAAEARVASLRQSEYMRWSRHNSPGFNEDHFPSNNNYMQDNSGILVKESAQSLHSKFANLERNVRAQQLNTLADTLSYLQASSFQKGMADKPSIS